MDKNITAKEIAEEIGVSPSTVSMVLNNQGDKYRISPDTQKKIMRAAKDIGYKHNKKRRRQAYSKKLIGVFCHNDFNRGLTADLFNGIKKYIREASLEYEVIVFPFDDGNLEEKEKWLTSGFMAGAVMIALEEKDLDFLESKSFDIPLILFNRAAKGFSSVMVDNYAVGYKAMSVFMERGHKIFGVVSSNYSSRSIRLRNFGFKDRLKKQGDNNSEMYCLPVAYDEETDQGGYNAMDSILKSGKIPTGIFVSIDDMVSGVVRRIHDLGLKIPDDVEIISYGNKEINLIVEPNISSFATPTEDMGYSSARILCDYIEKGTLSDSIKISFEAECIFRESCFAK